MVSREKSLSSSRISNNLGEMYEEFTSGGETESFRDFMTIDESGEKVAVRITTGEVEELLPALEEYDFEVIGSEPDLNFLEGWLPIDALPEVETLADQELLGVKPVYQPVTNVGSVTSQADFVAEKLSVSFEEINLPETIDFGDTGSVTLKLTNTSERLLFSPVRLNLFISTDDDRDSESDERNDGLLSTEEVFVFLRPGESKTVEIDYENLSSVVAPGSYHLLAEIEGGDFTSELVSANGSDSVLTWHATALNAIQEFGEVDNDTTGIGIEPTVGSRALAIVQTSVFNAANAFEERFEFYLGLDPGEPADGASVDAAVAGASVTALANVLPGTDDLREAIVARLENSLDLSTEQVESLLTAAGLGSILEPPTPGDISSFPDPFLSEPPTPSEPPDDVPEDIEDIVNGFQLGVNAASQVLDARSDDGFTGFFDGIDDPATYDPPGDFEEYVWIGEPQIDAATGESVFVDDDGNVVPFALSPGWEELTTFSGEAVDDFIEEANVDDNGDGVLLDGRPFANPVDTSVSAFQQNRYITEINQVQTLGGLESTPITDVTRSQDQTEVAMFWAYDRADTFRPYGQLHQIAEEAGFRSGDDLLDNARTLALTSIALADASISAWSGKYDEVQSRPQDVISGDNGQGIPISAIDGFNETVTDFDWKPLLPDPPFPDYLSGHSTFAGAFSGVLDTLFPDATDIEVVSQELVPGNGIHNTSNVFNTSNIFNTSNDEQFDIEDFGPVRTFESYREIGAEDAISRVFGGVHVLEATNDAVNIGNVIGQFVADNLLAPVV